MTKYNQKICMKANKKNTITKSLVTTRKYNSFKVGIAHQQPHSGSHQAV